MKAFIFLFMMLLFSTVGFAQEAQQVAPEVQVQSDTVVIPTPDQLPTKGEDQTTIEYVWELLSYLIGNWRDILGSLSALVLAIEVVISAIPTSKDWSLLTRIRKWLDNARLVSLLTKNRKSGGGAFKVKSEPEND